MNDVPQQVTSVVRTLFTGRTRARYGPFRLEDDGETLVAGTLYRFRVVLDTGKPGGGGTAYALMVFTDVGEGLAGPMWEQEMRILLRIANLGHEALPTVHSGGYDKEHRVAWVATSAVDHTLAEGGAAYYRHHRPDALRRLLELADGLAVLHGQGLVHRNLWPGVVGVEESADDEEAPVQLRLGRFEMSSMLTNLLRGAATDPTGRAVAVKTQLRAQGVGSQGLGALPYFPRERLEFLFGAAESAALDTDRGDVFGLGVIAWEWFVGELPVDEYVTERSSDEGLLEGLRGMHDAMRARLAGAGLSAPLEDLLREMLTADFTGRATSAQVVDRLTRRYEAILGTVEPELATDGLLVLFMPALSEQTLHHDWQWAKLDPKTPEGEEEIREIVEADMRGATLVHSPEGATPYVPPGGAEEKQRRAQWVLFGRRAAWFCVENRPRESGPFGDRKLGPPMEDVLRIMHPVPLYQRRVRDLLATPLRRTISSVTALPTTFPGDLLEKRRAGRPKWRPLLESVETPSVRAEQTTFLAALEWFLQYQSAELDVREYPFVRIGPGSGERIELEYDRERAERRATGKGDLLTLLRRTAEDFGDYFASDEAFGDSGVLEFRSDVDGRPGRVGGTILDAVRQDADRIAVRPAHKTVIPERGWLRGGDAFASAVGLGRQRQALAELKHQRGLLGQLESPGGVQTAIDRWRGAGEDLHGGADRVVRQILTSEPFFALHGPPGTGKTTVVARAVEAYLEKEPGARLLISAQANDSLDNLALRILERLESKLPYITPLRVGRDAGRIDAGMRRWQLDTLTQEVTRRARATALERVEKRSDAEPIREILGKWVRAIDSGGLEIRDRLRRGANIVFATTSGSNPDDLDVTGAFSTFDWVIVEEAAKAWPTEVAIPLVRGVRWTLIGDHRQLPGFRRREMSRVLELCAESDLPDLKFGDETRESYERAFDYFAELFTPSPRPRPVGRLVRQFRMREPIADVVSKAFYESRGDPALETDASTELDAGVCRPHQLAGESLVWLDTAGASCAQEPRWANEGEATLIARLLDEFDLFGDEEPDGDLERLAVLTPWHAQRRMLEASLGPRRSRVVHTVDSFQGREAEIVIVSLVRDASWGESGHSKLGHLADEQRANVMLSRAKRLNVLVGNREHFATSDVDFWSVVCDRVAARGLVLPAVEVLA